MHHVAIVDDILFAFQTHAPGLLRAVFAVMAYEFVIRDRLRADEALLEVCVDLARGLRRSRTLLRRPGTRFFRALREEGLQTKQVIITV